MAIATFSVSLEVGKPATIVVNGQTLDPFTFAFAGMRPAPMGEPGGAPALLLEVVGEGTIEGEGVAVMVRDDEVGYLRKFLETVDPGELERRTVAHQVSLSDSPGTAVLKALLEMIDG